MNWNAVGAIAELLGAVGVMASLWYVALQVRQSTVQSRIAVHRGVVNELGRTLQSLATNRELTATYVRALQDYDALSVVEKAQVSAFLAHLFQLWGELHRLHESGELADEDWQAYANAFADVISYPGVQSWFAGRMTWMRADFKDFVLAKIKEDRKVALYQERSRR